MVSSPVVSKGKNADKNRSRRVRRQAAKADGSGDSESTDVDVVEVVTVPMDETEEKIFPSEDELELEHIAKKCKGDDGDASSSAVAAPPPAAPVIPGPGPSMSDLLQAIGAMSTGIDKRFDSFEARFEGTDRKIVAVSTEFKAFQAEVNAKFAALNLAASAGTEVIAKKVTPPWHNTAAGSSSAAAPSAAAAAPAARQPAPQAHQATASPSEVGRKVYALGFPRKLPRPALLAFWDEVKAKMPLHLVADAKFQGGHGKSFGVVFPSRDAARLFSASFKENQSADCKWSSPRDGEGTSPISFRVERTITERDRGRALSKSWTLLSPLVRLSKAWKPGMKLVTDPGRGTIAIATGLDMWELIELKPVGDGFSIIAFEDNLKHFDVGPAIVEAVRASTAAPAAASSSAAAPSQ
jgi:hypothetical protein